MIVSECSAKPLNAPLGLELVSHEFSLFSAAVLQLVGLAVYTGRTLVLPVL